MKFNLTDERAKWATVVWQKAVEAKETTAESLDEYLTAILQPTIDNLLIDITNSWKPEDSEELKARREDVIAHLKEISAEKLEIIEAAIEAAKEI